MELTEKQKKIIEEYKNARSESSTEATPDDKLKSLVDSAVSGIESKIPVKTGTGNVFTDVAVGAGKSFYKGMQDIGNLIAKPISKAMGKYGIAQDNIGFSEESLTPVNTAQKVGGYLETAAELLLPAGATKKGVQAIKSIGRLTSKLPTIAKETMLVTPTLEQAAKEVLQGKTGKLKGGIEALKAIDIKDVNTYSKLDESISKKVSNLVTKVDTELGKDPTRLPLKNLIVEKATKAGKNVKINYVDTALKQLAELYTKTGDAVEHANVVDLYKQAVKQGLTKLEVNDIARTYGKEFGEKAFGKKTGEALTSVNAQMFENVRKGVKEIARQGITGKKAKKADLLISKLLDTSKLIKKNIEKVNEIQGKIQERGLLEKVGYNLSKYSDILTGGTMRGLVGGVLPRGVGNKTMNFLDLEEVLARNLKIIQEIGKAKSTKQIRELSKKLTEPLINKAGLATSATKNVINAIQD